MYGIVRNTKVCAPLVCLQLSAALNYGAWASITSKFYNLVDAPTGAPPQRMRFENMAWYMSQAEMWSHYYALVISQLPFLHTAPYRTFWLAGLGNPNVGARQRKRSSNAYGCGWLELLVLKWHVTLLMAGMLSTTL